MRPIRSISVLMPTWQGEEFLERVLGALAPQQVALPWDFLAIDSGSTDRTLSILESWRSRFPVPLRVEGIHASEFDHGDTRNLLAARSQGDLLVFLTQDAIPSSPRWLADLAANFQDERVGAAYCRNVPRPDAELLTRLFSEHDPGYQAGRRAVRLPPAAVYALMSAHEKRLLYNFNDVASAIRRELWRRHPFPRTWFGEDLLMARALLEAGYTVVYDDAATVEHSHDYSGEQMRARARIDGRFNAEWLDRTCVETEADAEILVERQLARDREALRAAGLTGAPFQQALARASELRRAAYFGMHEGGMTELRRASTRMLERESLHVLFVVHAFPPETWAGTEVYTLELALELQRLGHRCTVLARASAAESGSKDFALELGEFEGLRVWRMLHRLQHESLRQTYDQPKAVAAFREVLLREQPDVVHFQHLLHLSVGLVRQAVDFGLPTVLHCHDYWALCSRVQMIRPDGARCEENQGAGCFLCVQELGLGQIARLRALERRAPAAIAELAELAGDEPDSSGARRPARRARWNGFGDLHARQQAVLEAYALADLRVSPSRFLRSKLLATGAFDAHTTLYSQNGLRTSGLAARAKTPDPQGRLRVGFVGSIVWYKGVATLIEAMNLLAGRAAVLRVFGDFKPETDPHHAELRALARSGNVEFRGRFENQRLREVHSEIDVLVVPSLWFENAPITIQEAFLFRTPVVASGIGGMAEYVRDGVDGLHFAPGNAVDLARALGRFLGEPELAARLAANVPHVKTIEENARELEFRYRSLATRVRARKSRLLIERKGVDTRSRMGPVEQQGADLVLLRPGAAAVEYDIALAGAGRREIEIEVLALGAETKVMLGGRVLLDGREVGRIAPFSARQGDELKSFRFGVDLDRAPSVLRLESRPGEREREVFLRIARVAVREPATETARPASEPRP